MNCIICGFALSGKQSKYCSVPCQIKGWKVNNREEYLAGKKAYRTKNLAKLVDYNRQFKARGIAKPITSSGKLKAIIQSRGNKCYRCNNSDKLQVHHIKPLRQGGSNEDYNLMVLCWDCHMLWHKMLRGFWLDYSK